MDWGFIWIMVILKIPLFGLLGIVWWAVKQSRDPADDLPQGDGGQRIPPRPHHPRRPFPRAPRRGPHGDPALPSPRRVRTVVARARSLDH